MQEVFLRSEKRKTILELEIEKDIKREMDSRSMSFMNV